MELSASILGQLRDTLEREDEIVGYSQHEVELPDGRKGVRLYVAEDAAAAPAEIAGLPTEVIVSGRNAKQAVAVGVDHKTRVRPLVAGYSISGDAGGTGTLGYFVKRQGSVCVLSACHVMPKVGGAVIQPGKDDKGTGGDKIADVVQALDKPERGIDCAAAKLTDQTEGTGWKPELAELGRVTGIGTLKVGQTVKKSGRTSGVTQGTVKELGATAKFDEGIYVDQIGVARFTEGGDSGSLVVTEDVKAVGLLMGANNVHSWVNPIALVLAALDNATLV
jgi:hypothetical protein